MVPVMALMGGIYGVLLYLMNLPFMLLAFRNSFYRERFCKVFGLQPVPDLAGAGAEISERPPNGGLSAIDNRRSGTPCRHCRPLSSSGTGFLTYRRSCSGRNRRARKPGSRSSTACRNE